MWECGVATKPDSPETRIIVLQCGTEVPPVFQDQVRVQKRIKPLALKAGIPNVNFRMLRRSFATWNKANLKDAQIVMGHTSPPVHR
jgi:integrase